MWASVWEAERENKSAWSRAWYWHWKCEYYQALGKVWSSQVIGVILTWDWFPSLARSLSRSHHLQMRTWTRWCPRPLNNSTTNHMSDCWPGMNVCVWVTLWTRFLPTFEIWSLIPSDMEQTLFYELGGSNLNEEPYSKSVSQLLTHSLSMSVLNGM